MQPAAVVFLLSLAQLFSFCHKEKTLQPPASAVAYDSIPVGVNVDASLKEVSGIAASAKHTSSFWVQEDSGNPSALYRISADGKLLQTVTLKGAENYDWEDLQRSGNDLYVGDIGDNARVRKSYSIYYLAEPAADVTTVSAWKQIRFKYADSAHDAEAFVVDGATKDIYIITKRDAQSGIYRIAFPYSEQNTAERVSALPYNMVVSAALSPDEKYILVKTYAGILQYTRNGKSIAEALQTIPEKLHYKLEPQGEAVCFAHDNSGYYTISEKRFNADVQLFFYKRN